MQLPALLPLCALLGSALPAQLVAEGHRAPLHDLPPAAGQVLVLDGARVVWFDGTRLLLADGASTRELLRFPQSRFGSFTRALDDGHLLFGESSSDGIWLVPLAQGRTPVQLATLKLNYDAVRWGPRHAIVSAKTGGFPAANNELWAVDLVTGALDLIAELPGASGPLAADAAGNLWYATASNAFPPPPGATDLLRFAAAKVAAAFGPGKLGPADAELRVRGLDSAAALVFDDDGDAFVTDWKNRRVLELDDVVRRSPAPKPLVEYAGATVDPIGLQMLPRPASARGVFEPFQPDGTGALIVHESDFVATNRLRAVTPQRAISSVAPAAPVPPGPFTIVTLRGAARAGGVLAVRFGHGGGELMFDVGPEAPLLWDPALLQPWQTFPLQFDANGRAAITLLNPGIRHSFPLTVQCAFLAPDRRRLGSAPPLSITLQ
jgi:hypothetical protein